MKMPVAGSAADEEKNTGYVILPTYLPTQSVDKLNPILYNFGICRCGKIKVYLCCDIIST